jgi:tellurite resistance protein TerC
MFRRLFSVSYRAARRIAIAVIGATVILLGIAMLVLPGPGLLTIVGGLAILSLEFAFAKRWLDRIKRATHQAVDEVKRRVRRKGPPTDPSPPM